MRRLRSLHARQTDSGMTPHRMSRWNTTHPRHRPAKASSDAATSRPAISATATASPPTSSATSAEALNDQPDGLGESLGRPGYEPVLATQPRRDDLRDQATERAEPRPRRHSRQEAERQGNEDPPLADGQERDRLHHHTRGDQSSRGLVDRIGEGEQVVEASTSAHINTIRALAVNSDQSGRNSRATAVRVR